MARGGGRGVHPIRIQTFGFEPRGGLAVIALSTEGAELELRLLSTVFIRIGVCGLVGRVTTFVGDEVGSIPTCCTLEVWQWTFGS
jgi:hypothetical protein